MMLRPSKMSRGISLVETLIYAALLVVIAYAVVTSLLSLRVALERARVDRELAEAATEILERIGREARYASDITASSVLGTSPGTLDLDQGATTTRFYVSNGDVVVRQNGVDVGSLDGETIDIAALTFTEYSHATSTAVRTTLTLTATTPYRIVTRTFYATALLRGSYDD